MKKTDQYILAVDHGTSAVKTALVSVTGEIIDTEKMATPIHYLPGGGAEQDPEGWWQAFLKTGKALIARGRVLPKKIQAVCVSSTFSSTVVVDKNGDTLMPALTWMDSRGGKYVKQAMDGFPNVLGYGLGKILKWVPKTGGAPTLSGKDDIGHYLLVKHEFPEIYEKAHLFLPSKDFFNLRLTGTFASSYDAMTLFWVTDTRDIHNIRYDQGLMDILGVDRAKLPDLMYATDVVGALKQDVADELGLSRDIRVVCGSPDHQAAGMGSGAVTDFAGHIYIGTSSWVQCPVPFKKTDPLHSIASFPFSLPGKYYAANEQDMAGGCLNFLVNDILGWKDGNRFGRANDMAGEVGPGSQDLIFAPWLNGERTPVDDHHLGGGFFNIRKTTTTGHMIRAVMEGVALNTRWSAGYVEKFIGRKMDPINMVGGGACSDLWCQMHADTLGRSIRQVKDPMEANARGAAFIAGLGLGIIKVGDIPGFMEYSAVFDPIPENQKIYDRLFSEFLTIHKKNRAMFHRLNR